MNAEYIVKVRYGDDVRKVALPSSMLRSLGAITNWAAETFNLDNTRNNLLMKYKDEDGDLITLINDDDVRLALSTEPKLYLHVNFCEDVSAASNSGSRHASPCKNESVAVIHPSNEDDTRHFLSGLSSPQQRQQKLSSEAQERFDEVPLNGRPSLNQQQQSRVRRESHQSPSSAAQSQERFAQQPPMTGMPPQQQQMQQQQYPSQPQQGAFAPSMMNGLPPPQQQQQRQQLQQQPSFSGMPPPPSGQNCQQQQPYPPQSAPLLPPPSMNGLPPLQQQQQQPYQPGQTQQFLLPPPPTSMNGLPPPPQQQQQQQPYPSQSGPPQGYGSSMNGNPSMNLMPPQSGPPGAAPFTQNFGPPPSSSIPGLGNPFARQQLHQRPGQR